MKPSVNNLNSDQPKKLSKREDKKRVNIKSNHSLYFQIGLIVSMLLVFVVMEMSLGYKTAKEGDDKDYILEEPPMFVFTVFKDPVLEIPKKKIKEPLAMSKTITEVLKEVPNNTKVTETKTETTETPLKDRSVHKNSKKPFVNNDGPRNMKTVEFVPVYPGCESLSNNEERRACMSSKISRFVQKKFRTDKFENLVNTGKQQIYVQFKIDATGSIVDVIARGPHNSLENEATRVIGQLPQMQPGKQGSTNVAVMYSLPIVFQAN